MVSIYCSFPIKNSIIVGFIYDVYVILYEFKGSGLSIQNNFAQTTNNKKNRIIKNNCYVT